MPKFDQNEKLYNEATEMLVGGVCAGGRINYALKRPLFLDHADGSHVYTIDGEDFIDYHCGSGGLLFGWNNPNIKRAMEECISKGFYMNYDSDYTVEFAKLMRQLIPTVEKIRFTNSGTEATLAAIRAARYYTGKNLIIKFDGHFHGMHEMIWFNGDPIAKDFDEYGEVRTVKPDVVGMPTGIEEFVKIIRFNDIDAVKHAFAKYRGDIAAIIMEPVSYDTGCVVSTPEYMQQLRKLCDEEGILMIFDEVISGLRFRPGSAQGYYGVQPDLSTFAKAIANGFSLAVIGGKKEIMDVYNPVGPVVCSGTASGNLMSVMAGIECLKMALEPDFYDRIEHTEKLLCGGFDDLLKKHEIPGHIRSMGAQWAIYLGYDDPEIDYNLEETVKLFRKDWYQMFCEEAIKENLYFFTGGPKKTYPNHCGFTIAHSDEDIAITLERLDKVLAAMKPNLK